MIIEQAHGRRQRVARLLGILLPLIAAPILFAQQRVDKPGGKVWEVLDHCRLMDNPWNDGYSFHVRYGERKYVFRLYFVDAPEIIATFPQRIEDQAAFFGISTNAVMEVGRDAARFTKDHLASEFTVITRWQNARGQG